MRFRVVSKVGSGKKGPVSPSDSDQELIQKAKEGDEGAMSVLYARYRRKVLNYVYRFTGNRTTAEELAQETFVRVVENLHRYKPTGSVGGWIYRIAGNLALNALRDQPVIPLSLDEPVSLGDDDSVDRKEAIAGPGPRPDEEASRSETEDAIQRCLMHIPPQQREAVILCDIEQYSYKEAAEILRVPINTVASRLARGRAELAKGLGYLKRDRGR